MGNVRFAGFVDDGENDLIHAPDHRQFPWINQGTGETAERLYLTEADGVG
jgi:hypothetical protein